MKEKSKNIGLFFWNSLQIFIIVYVILVTGFIICKNNFGFTQIGKFVFVIINEDNAKFIDDSVSGELVIIKEDNKVQKGDVIYYYSAVNEKYVVKSGVVSDIDKEKNDDVFILDDESQTKVSSIRLIGTTISNYSIYGRILDLLTSSFGFLLFVLLPVLLIFIYKIYELITIMKVEKKILKFNKEILDGKNLVDNDDMEII